MSASCCETVVISDDDLVLISTPTSDLVVITEDGEIVIVDSDIDVVVIDQSEIVIVDESVGPAGPAGPPGTGVITSVVAAAIIQQYRVVALDPSDQAYMPSAATFTETDAVFGISLSAALTGEALNVQTDGRLITPALWTVGPLWLGTAGMLTSVAPVLGNALQIACATSPTTLVIRPQSLFVLS